MRLFPILLFCISLIACDATENTQSSNAEISIGPLVVASNYPLYFFASQIAGEAGDTLQVVLPDIEGDPANWVPTADDIELLQSADLVLLNGAGYESWLDWITLGGGNMINTTAGIDGMLIGLEESVTHQHGPAGEHAHRGTAFTTWLDPQLAGKQADAIASTLESLIPEQAGIFKKNLSTLQGKLTALDAELSSAFSAWDGQPILFSHPVYQYLENRYDLNGISLHWEPDVEPGISDWIELQKIIQQHPAAIMLWEEEPLASISERLSELGIRAIVFLTASNLPEKGDYFVVMRGNAERL